MALIREQQQSIFDALRGTFGYTSTMQAPCIEKVVVSTGIGSVHDKARFERIQDRLRLITGQKPAPRGARKSIASFKTRQGDIIGYQTTLRGNRMYHFLDRLINIALPRTKDFRGLDANAIDAMGNLTIGIREHTIFPETADEELKDIFGLAVTVVTTAKSRDEAKAYLTKLGFPFKE